MSISDIRVKIAQSKNAGAVSFHSIEDFDVCTRMSLPLIRATPYQLNILEF